MNPINHYKQPNTRIIHQNKITRNITRLYEYNVNYLGIFADLPMYINNI